MAALPTSPVRPLPGKPVERLILTGFMGSGKTTVGRILARQLGWRFADLDDHVTLREGLTVPQLILNRGETAFRTAEAAALVDLLAYPRTVIALGGGAPETAAVRESLSNNGSSQVVYLEAPFEALFRRCVHDCDDPLATVRPLLGERASTFARFQRRLPLYQQLAHITVDATADSPEVIAETILQNACFFAL